MKKISCIKQFLLLIVTLLCSCSGDEGGNDSAVVLDTTVKTDYSVYADDVSIDGAGIRFSTRGAWNAVVLDMTQGEGQATATWLSLSQYGGDSAGDYTVAVSMSRNFTGHPRKAAIRIMCGKTMKTVTVEQKGGKADGTKMRRVKSVSVVQTFGDAYMAEGNTPTRKDYTYSYDEQGRVANVESKTFTGKNADISTYTFSYGESSKVVLNYHRDGILTVDRSYDLVLNGQGSVIEIKPCDGGDDVVSIGYTDDGRFETLSIKSPTAFWEKFTYSNGMIIRGDYAFSDIGEKGYQDFVESEFYPNHIPAGATNINLLAIIFRLGLGGEEEIEPMLWSAGLLGKSPDCMMELMSISHKVPVLPTECYITPDQVHTTTSKRTVWPDDETLYKISYHLDGNFPVSFTVETPYEVWESCVETHVGHDLVDANDPGLGYSYTKKTLYDKKLRDECSLFTFTVSYE